MTPHSRIVVEERTTLLGYPFRVYREEPTVPRISEQFLDCSVYLYQFAGAAQKGVSSGGSGFLVGMSMNTNWHREGSCPLEDQYHLYAVSNRHVVLGEDPGRKKEDWTASPVVRLNTHDGKTDVIPATVGDWILSDEDDLAVLPVAYSSAHKYQFVDVDRQFLDHATRDRCDVGIGDEVFMVGRYVNREGRQLNSPSVRFGHVAMMAGEPIPHPTNKSGAQDGFLIEIHSIAGFSGSPVFVRPLDREIKVSPWSAPNTVDSGLSRFLPLVSGGGPWLLGIDCGHDTRTQTVYYKGVGIDFKENTGMALVIPAWKLRNLLFSPRLLSRRYADQGELVDRIKNCPTVLDGGQS